MTRHSAMHVAILCTLMAGGCAVGPDYQRPEVALPEHWVETSSGSRADTAGERWWQLYGDSALERLVDEALTYNADVQVAAARVLEAQAQAGLADADRMPVVTANAAASRTRNSLEGAMPLPAGAPRTQTSHRATLNASYELDLWGKYRRASEAARAQLLAAESAQQAVRLSLVAQVAQQYFALLAADAETDTLRRTLQTRNETLDLVRRRLAAGMASEYDLHLIEAEHAAVRAQLAGAVQAQAQQEVALAVLLGRSPREVMTGKTERGTPAPQTALWVPAGLPSDLLLRRPDLREAEQRLVAENARIGVARSQMFPSLSLTGYLGGESTDLGNLFSGPAGVYQFAAALSQPIFNAGRTTYATRAAEARREQALAQYRQAVANAFADVRNALAAQDAARQALEAQTQRAAALRAAFQQATLRYEGGAASRLELLDAERQQLAADLARSEAERAQRTAVADLFKALGGGWSNPPAAAP